MTLVKILIFVFAALGLSTATLTGWLLAQKDFRDTMKDVWANA